MQQLNCRRELRSPQRIVARTDAGRQLDQLRPKPLASCFDKAAHRHRDGLGIDHQLARELDFDERLRHLPGGWSRKFAFELQCELPMPWPIELDREDGLPPTEHKLPFLDEQGEERAEQQLTAVSVSVDRLIDGDIEPAREIVVLVAGADGGDALEHGFEVAMQEQLVLVDAKSNRRVQGLQVHASCAQPSLHDALADPVG